MNKPEAVNGAQVPCISLCAPCMGADMRTFNSAYMNSCSGSNRSRVEDEGNCETVRDRGKEAVVEVASSRTETSYKA